VSTGLEVPALTSGGRAGTIATVVARRAWLTSRPWRSTLIAASVAVAVVAGGCGGSGDGEAQVPDPVEPAPGSAGPSGAGSGSADAGDDGAPVADAGGHYPLTIDNCGFEVTFEERPDRVVVLDGSSISETTTLVALGLDDSIVASAQRRQVRSEQPDLVDPIAAVPTGDLAYGAGAEEVSRESILAAEPDLVISATSDSFSTVVSPAATGITREELAGLGIASYVTPVACDGQLYGGSSSFDLYAGYELIDDLGRMFDVVEAADALVADQEAVLYDIAGALDGVEPVGIALLDPAAAASSGTANDVAAVRTGPIENAVLAAAGGFNAFDNLFVTAEEMAATEVDVVVVVAPTGSTPPEEQVEAIWAAFPRWAATADEAWTWVSDGLAVGPTQHLAVSKIAEAAHPDRLG
jgi:iron complex transport system substrate-binding protein